MAVPRTRAQDAPVTLYRWTTETAPLSLDPQRIVDQVSAEITENLFLALTTRDPITGEVKPALATAWEVSGDGLSWTFTLRDDVYWVRYDPDTRLTARVRAVTARDFVDGLQRTCAPEGGELGARLADLVPGCDVIHNTVPVSTTPDVLAALKAQAPTPHTLVIQMREPSGWFLSITPDLRPAPLDIIDRYGIAWTLPGNLVTTGPFVLVQHTAGQRIEMARLNNHLPADLEGDGNVARVVYNMVRDTNAGFSLYMEHKVDISALPPAEAPGFVGQRLGEAVLLGGQDATFSGTGPHVAYLGFANDRAPFNNALVRRAFAAALDREAFVAEVLGGQGLPMTHLTPPGVFGAPLQPSAAIDLGYDPDLARTAFADAGYPGCARFPYVTLVAHQSTATWVDFMVRAWGEVLGCDASVFQVELVDFSTLLARTSYDASWDAQPHMFTSMWRGEYPDAHNWLGDMLYCHAAPRTRRPCAPVDDLIAQAAATTDPAARRALYAEISAAFFGPEGDMPIAPLYQYAQWEAVKPWVDWKKGDLWDTINIDVELQERCRHKEGDMSACSAPLVTLPAPETATPTAAPSAIPTATGEYGGVVIPVGTSTPTATP